MTLKSSALTAAVLVLCGATASAQTNAVGQRIAFVGCPILRNTEPVPCWLGEAKGELYYLGPQGDLQAEFYPPQFNHRMLAEGVVTADRYCGGIVLKGAKASVLPDVDPTCNITLPAMGYAESTKLRGSGPSGVRGSTENYQPPRPAPPRRPQPPFTAKDFVATFDADTDRIWRSAQATVTEASRYALAANARTIEITGYRAAIRLVDGKDFVEHDYVAENRAKAVEESLRTSGLPKDAKVAVKWVAKPAPSTGTAKDAEARRVVIAVKP